jgi:hypothetical protein
MAALFVDVWSILYEFAMERRASPPAGRADAGPSIESL